MKHLPLLLALCVALSGCVYVVRGVIRDCPQPTPTPAPTPMPTSGTIIVPVPGWITVEPHPQWSSGVYREYTGWEHEHRWSESSVPCPDRFVGCLAYHFEWRCGVCGILKPKDATASLIPDWPTGG